MNQIEIHKKIDEFLKAGTTIASVDVVRELVCNEDAKRYFYTQANEIWLDWLWENKLLDAIREIPSDTTKYTYHTPELDYLTNVVEKDPEKVAQIILQIPISKEHFNPEVVDRFLWICSKMPAPTLVKIVGKIRDDNWVKLMNRFNRWGFEYENMLKKLNEAGNLAEILTLADPILSIRTKKEDEEKNSGITTDNPFYLNDLSQTKIFEYLVDTDEKYVEDALKIVLRAMADIVKSGEEEKEGIFKIKETFHLFDVDFFTLEFKNRHYSHRDDVRDLATVIKKLSERLMDQKHSDEKTAQELYEKYFSELPDSRSMWRLQLFILSLRPSVFKDILKEFLFRIFKCDGKPWELIMGSEYEWALQKGFPEFSDSEKKEYISGILELFGKEEESKRRFSYGSDLLSMIADQPILLERKEEIEKLGFKINPNHKPEPSIGESYAESVVSRSPISLEEFSKLSVPTIVTNLKTIWTPKELAKKNTSEDYLRPINAEGIAGFMQADMKKRFDEYIDCAELFFERNVLDQHYTYSFLRGVESILKEKNIDFEGKSWDKLFALLKNVSDSGIASPFIREARERESFDAWLSNWDGVHSAAADVIQVLIQDEDDKSILRFEEYRDRLIFIIEYLLLYPDPTPEDEAKYGNDPLSRAINTSRGRAFESFALFLYRDSEKFEKTEPIKISQGVKDIYEKLLNTENTMAIMFLFGRYLPSFFYRDRTWISGILPKIFPEAIEKKDLYFASWEGYLSTNLYEELFVLLRKFYEKAVDFDVSDYTKREYFKELDEALAIHIALAFAHYDNFDTNDELFKKFWEKNNIKRHQEFISFLGRHCVSRDRADLWMDLNKVKIEKLKDFWIWVIDNIKNKEVLSHFGFWMNLKSQAFKDKRWFAEQVRKTLEQTGGEIEWEYGLTDSLSDLSREAPEETIRILELYLKYLSTKEGGGWVNIDQGFIDIFKSLYKNPATSEKTYILINDLLLLGGQKFWILKDALNE